MDERLRKAIDDGQTEICRRRQARLNDRDRWLNDVLFPMIKSAVTEGFKCVDISYKETYMPAGIPHPELYDTYDLIEFVGSVDGLYALQGLDGYSVYWNHEDYWEAAKVS